MYPISSNDKHIEMFICKERPNDLFLFRFCGDLTKIYDNKRCGFKGFEQRSGT